MKTEISLFNENSVLATDLSEVTAKLMNYKMFKRAITKHDQEIKDMIDEMIKIEEKARDEFDKEESSWAFIEGRIFILKQLRSKL